MVFPEFVVPLTPQDLPADETYEMINASLAALQRASDGVFLRIQNVVEERRGRLDELLERLQRLESKISTLSNSNHPLAAQASALYPELDALRAWHPLFPSSASLGTQQVSRPGGALPPPPELPAEDGGRVKGQDTADLLHFFKQAQATSIAITTQGGPTSIPENLTSATSLLRYGGSRPAFGAADLDAADDSLPAVSSSLALQKAGFLLCGQASRRVAELDRPSPPQPFSFQELPFPPLQLPRTLPDLEASSQRSSARSGNGRPDSSQPRVPWDLQDPAFAGRQVRQDSESSHAVSGLVDAQGKSTEPEHSKDVDVSRGRAAEAAEAPDAELAADEAASTHSVKAVVEEASKSPEPGHNTGFRPSAAGPSEQAEGPPPSSAKTSGTEGEDDSAGQSAAAQPSELQAVAGGQAQNGQATSRQTAKRPPRSLPPSQGGSADALDAQGSSQRTFPRVGDAGIALDKHVDLGALGGVPSDLEHSIMLRQRSLSSRASLEDPPF